MANKFLTAEKIAEKAAFKFAENLHIINTFKDEYNSSFGGGTGNTAKLKRTMFSSASGDGVDASSTSNDQDQGSIDLTSNFDKHQKVTVTEAQLKYDIDDFAEQVLNPPMRKLASEAEAFAHKYIAENGVGLVGTAGTNQTTTDIFNEVAEYMDLTAVPYDMRHACLNPTAKRNMVRDAQSMHSNAKYLPPSLAKGLIGDIGGIDTYSHSIFNTHTTGNYGGTPLVNGASQSTSWANARDSYTGSLITDGWSASATLKKGDKFTIANVYSVHPETKESTGDLQVFNITADATANASGEVTLTITPPIMTSSGSGTTANYATVDSIPADNAAITVVTGTANTKYKQSIFYHPEAVGFVSLPYANSETSYADTSVMSLESGSLPVFVEKSRSSDNASDVIIIRVRFGLVLREPRACGIIYA